MRRICGPTSVACSRLLPKGSAPSTPHARFSTHISHFGHRTPNVQVAFWQAVKAVGYLPDQLGTSYYPTAGKTTFGAPDMFEFFKQTATALGERFDRQLFIAEYGYPSSLMQPPYPFNDPVPGYPQTEAGQHDFTRDLVAWGTASGHLAGIRPWAPDFCTSEWQPMSWFTPAANTTSAKPALHAITDALIARTAALSAANKAPARDRPGTDDRGRLTSSGCLRRPPGRVGAFRAVASASSRHEQMPRLAEK